MRKIQITLLVLIVLGLVALATQKIWVPKLVDKILESENSKVEVSDEEKLDLEFKLVGENCYTYDQLATNLAPYEVHETLILNIENEKVTGEKKGTQKGPDLTNGYSGSISGEIKENKIESIFSYIVEGSKGQEKEIYEIQKDKLVKLRYVLKDEKGILVPDTTVEPNLLDYKKVDCNTLPKQ